MAREPFNTRWAQGVESQNNPNSYQAPSNARIDSGWEGGQDKDAPPAGQENWWHNRVDSALQGVERRGVMDWHSEAVYGIGAPCYASDGNYYESLAESNVGNDPALTNGFWRLAGTSFFATHEPGDLKMVAHNKVPTQGWLKCNGAVLLRSSYPRLFSAIGTLHNTGGESSLQFRLPDFRGEFIRGFDDGKGVDSGRVFGSSQLDAIQNIIAYVEGVQFANGGGTAAAAFYVLPTGFLGHYTTDNVFPGQGIGSLNFDASRHVRTAEETRSRNKVASIWIKY